MAGPRAAVVGAGPAGFYAAAALARRFPSIRIDILESLPVPFGLVRYGVAPDHPATKLVAAHFTSFMKSAGDRVRFVGNVPAYSHPSLDAEGLARMYDVVVRATGAASPKNLAGDPNGVALSAHDALLWMNGHPLLHASPEGRRMEEAVRAAGDATLLGNGNVALDVARLLLRGADELRETDISRRALDALATAQVQKIAVVGRRGPVEAAWSTGSLREVVAKMPAVAATVDHALVKADLAREGVVRARRRALNLLVEHAADTGAAADGKKELALEFLQEPQAATADGGRTKLTMERTEMVPDGDKDWRLRRTGEEVTRTTDAAFFSLGYEGGDHEGYCVGWANGHARGIIGAAKVDADTVVEGLEAVDGKKGKEGIDGWVAEAGREVVDWQGWLRIDAEELARGKKEGFSRVKIESVDEMLSVARGRSLVMSPGD